MVQFSQVPWDPEDRHIQKTKNLKMSKLSLSLAIRPAVHGLRQKKTSVLSAGSLWTVGSLQPVQKLLPRDIQGITAVCLFGLKAQRDMVLYPALF